MTPLFRHQVPARFMIFILVLSIFSIYQGHRKLSIAGSKEEGALSSSVPAPEAVEAPPSPSGKFLTIVTGASGNHMDVLFTNLMATVKWRIVDRFHDSYFDHLRVIAYDLDVDESTKSKNKERISSIPFAEYRSFDFNHYPAHFNIEVNRGNYAWKAAIIEEVVREEQANNNKREVNLVYWIDSGLVITTKCEDFDTDVEHCLQHGIYTPRNAPLNHSCHPGTAAYLNISEEMYKSGSGVASGIDLIDVKNKTVYDRIVKPWVDCSMVENCIAPPGASLRNHRYDQGVLSALLAKHAIQLTTKPGEAISTGPKSSASTSCVVRGNENRNGIPEGVLFNKEREKIISKADNGTMSVRYYCEGQEWFNTAISCHERVLYLKSSYKLSDHDSKVAILDQGCLCPP